MQNRSRSYPHIGEVYMMRFDGRAGEQCGWRPGIILQNDIGNKYSPNVIAIPLTSAIKKTDQPTHVVIRANDTGLRKDSMALCENPSCISKEMIGVYITTLSSDYLKEIAVASLLATSAIMFLDQRTLLGVWKRANEIHASAGCSAAF